MKKILLSSIVLLIFALSITIFQISCQKDADAETPSSESSTSVNKILYCNINENSSKTIYDIWICNYDGSDNTKVNLSLPNGIVFPDHTNFLHLSPDGEKIFFTAGPDSGEGYPWQTDLYSCNIDGSNLIKIVSGNSSTYLTIFDVK